jgi:small GTP-binding protein
MSFFKVLVIGDVSAGKTALVHRLVNDSFSDKYKATLGCEFGLKTIEIGKRHVRVQLWDLAGQDRLGGINRLYCRDANGAVVVSDITNERSIERALNWKGQIDEHVRMRDGSRIPMVLCLTKCDLVTSTSTADLSSTVNRCEFTAGFFTSAKSGLNVELALQTLVEEMLSRGQLNLDEEEIRSIQATRLTATMPAEKAVKKSKCC